ncbi:hypothetical protein [Anaeromusa acidaminophila]|uniref:hypothetical protein n=1 Tax=Anaeromusa acidaminophila TaxID=81464 RepID=UPI000382AB28|nr:hypothetical protein [Anaeromusa acidaminophila]
MKEITSILTNKQIKEWGYCVVGSPFSWHIEKNEPSSIEVTMGGKVCTMTQNTTPDDRLKDISFDTQTAGREYFTRNIIEITGNTDIRVNLPEKETPKRPEEMEVNYTNLEAAFWDKTNELQQGKAVLFKGIRYERRSSRIMSNSGKTNTDWRVSFHGEDGTVFAKDNLCLNRRNDPARNWGLGRE